MTHKRKKLAELIEIASTAVMAEKAFCATGDGGGVDPTCGNGSSSSGGSGDSGGGKQDGSKRLEEMTGESGIKEQSQIIKSMHGNEGWQEDAAFSLGHWGSLVLSSLDSEQEGFAEAREKVFEAIGNVGFRDMDMENPALKKSEKVMKKVANIVKDLKPASAETTAKLESPDTAEMVIFDDLEESSSLSDKLLQGVKDGGAFLGRQLESMKNAVGSSLKELGSQAVDAGKKMLANVMKEAQRHVSEEAKRVFKNPKSAILYTTLTSMFSVAGAGVGFLGGGPIGAVAGGSIAAGLLLGYQLGNKILSETLGDAGPRKAYA